MQVAAGFGDACKFRDDAIGMRDRMQHVTAYGEIEGAVGGVESKYGLMLEFQPGCEACISRTGQSEMVVNDIHAENMRPREEFGETRGNFAGAAPGVENARLGRERVAAKQWG